MSVDKTSKNEFFYQFTSPPDKYVACEIVLSSRKESFHKKTYLNFYEGFIDYLIGGAFLSARHHSIKEKI